MLLLSFLNHASAPFRNRIRYFQPTLALLLPASLGTASVRYSGSKSRRARESNVRTLGRRAVSNPVPSRPWLRSVRCCRMQSWVRRDFYFFFSEVVDPVGCELREMQCHLCIWTNIDGKLDECLSVTHVSRSPCYVRIAPENCPICRTRVVQLTKGKFFLVVFVSVRQSEPSTT